MKVRIEFDTERPVASESCKIYHDDIEQKFVTDTILTIRLTAGNGACRPEYDYEQVVVDSNGNPAIDPNGRGIKKIWTHIL